MPAEIQLMIFNECVSACKKEHKNKYKEVLREIQCAHFCKGAYLLHRAFDVPQSYLSMKNYIKYPFIYVAKKDYQLIYKNQSLYILRYDDRKFYVKLWDAYEFERIFNENKLLYYYLVEKMADQL